MLSFASHKKGRKQQKMEVHEENKSSDWLPAYVTQQKVFQCFESLEKY